MDQWGNKDWFLVHEQLGEELSQLLKKSYWVHEELDKELNQLLKKVIEFINS